MKSPIATSGFVRPVRRSRCRSTTRSSARSNGSGRSRTAVDDGEEGRVGADSQGEGQDGGRGEGRFAAKDSQRLAHVVGPHGLLGRGDPWRMFSPGTKRLSKVTGSEEQSRCEGARVELHQPDVGVEHEMLDHERPAVPAQGVVVGGVGGSKARRAGRPGRRVPGRAPRSGAADASREGTQPRPRSPAGPARRALPAPRSSGPRPRSSSQSPRTCRYATPAKSVPDGDQARTSKPASAGPFSSSAVCRVFSAGPQAPHGVRGDRRHHGAPSVG